MVMRGDGGMARAGLEELVEEPLKTLPSRPATVVHVPSFKTQAGISIGGSSGIGGIYSVAFRIPAISEHPIQYMDGYVLKDSYMIWLMKVLDDPNGDSSLEDSILAFIRGWDNVSLARNSPTLQKMTQTLKSMLFPYEFVLTFVTVKGILDALMTGSYYVLSKRKEPLEEEIYKKIAKAHGKQTLIDLAAAGGVYGLIKYQLEKIRGIFLGYTIDGEGVEGALRRINEYFAYTTGPGKLLGNILMVGVPVGLVISHYILLRKAYREIDEFVKKLKNVIIK